MNKGDKVKLNQDCELTRYGATFSYRKGQTGEMIFPSDGDDIVVALDGYEEDKKRNKEQRERTGEGFNIVPYINAFPEEFLETQKQ